MNTKTKRSHTDFNPHPHTFFTALRKNYRFLLIVSTLLLSGCLAVSDKAVVFNDHSLSNAEMLALAGSYVSVVDFKRVTLLKIEGSLQSWTPQAEPAITNDGAPSKPPESYQVIRFDFKTGDYESVQHSTGVAALSRIPGTQLLLATVPTQSFATRDFRTETWKPLLGVEGHNQSNIFFTLEQTSTGLNVGFFESKGIAATPKPLASETVLNRLSDFMEKPVFSRFTGLEKNNSAALFTAALILNRGFAAERHRATAQNKVQETKKQTTSPSVSARPITKLVNPHGWYEVSNSGIDQVIVTKKRPHLGYDFVSVVHTAADPRVARRNQKATKGTWQSSLGSWVWNGYAAAVSKACGRETYGPTRADYLEPVFNKSGIQRKGIYRFKSSSKERYCRVGNFSARTCKLVSCAKWSDHPDYRNQSPTFLVRDLNQARKIFARMEHWTYDKHGAGSVSKGSSRQSGNSGYSASEDARQSSYDAAVDLWLDN